MGPREQRESGGLINFAYHMEERAWLKARSHRTHTHAYGQVSEPSASFDPPARNGTSLFNENQSEDAALFPSSFNLRLMLVVPPLGSRGGDNYSSRGNV